MNRFFRSPNGGAASYAALAIFVAAYLAAMIFVLAPDILLTGRLR